MTAISEDELVKRAIAARDRAYAPYSDFQVGAAVLAGGRVFEGANVENASYGLTICAERVAIARAVNEGALEIEAVAIASDCSPPAGPCGMCRQTMLEFSPEPGQVRVLIENTAGERQSFTLAELVPHGFTRSQLASR